MLTNAQGKVLGERGLGSTAYEHDYFSGAQINLMIGDVLIDAAVRCNVQKHQSKIPVYGYAQQYYSFLGAGQVIVTGELTVAFKEAGYLLYSLARFNNLKNESEWASPRYYVDEEGLFRRQPEQELTAETKFKSIAEEARRKHTMQANVEQMMEWQNVVSKYGKNSKQAIAARKNYNRIVKQLGALDDDVFEDWAETFEDTLWYASDIQNNFMADKINSYNFGRDVQIASEDILSHRSVDQYPPVDIWIIYGDTNNHATNHTVQKILKAGFLGTSKVIEVNDEPVYETYPFIAQNLV